MSSVVGSLNSLLRRRNQCNCVFLKKHHLMTGKFLAFLSLCALWLISAKNPRNWVSNRQEIKLNSLEILNPLSYLAFCHIFSYAQPSSQSEDRSCMHIKAVALGKDLNQPGWVSRLGVANKKPPGCHSCSEKYEAKQEKRSGQIPSTPPSTSSLKLTVSLASQSHCGDPAHSSMPQRLPAGSKQCRLHLGCRNGWLLDITLVSESQDRWHLTDV